MVPLVFDSLVQHMVFALLILGVNILGVHTDASSRRLTEILV